MIALALVKIGQSFCRVFRLSESLSLKKSVKDLLQVSSLEGKTFLDVGSGSGLFSLSAHQLGAKVHSFDFDPNSVSCTKKLRDWQKASNDQWKIEEGNVLDKDYTSSLGKFDVVYSWGVLHHTGAMFQAFENVAPLVKPGGYLALAIYNDQGATSKVWHSIKKLYCRLPWPLNTLLAVLLTLYFETGRSVKNLLTFKNPLPFVHWPAYKRQRGMSRWYDIVDWVGGYPFEVAKPEEIFHFFRDRGFKLVQMKTCAGGLGCNELTFVKEKDVQ